MENFSKHSFWHLYPRYIYFTGRVLVKLVKFPHSLGEIKFKGFPLNFRVIFKTL